jgi:hypothetical protein
MCNGELENLKARIVDRDEAERILGEPIQPLIDDGYVYVVPGFPAPAFDVSELHDFIARRQLGLAPAQNHAPAVMA